MMMDDDDDYYDDDDDDDEHAELPQNFVNKITKFSIVFQENLTNLFELTGHKISIMVLSR